VPTLQKQLKTFTEGKIAISAAAANKNKSSPVCTAANLGHSVGMAAGLIDRRVWDIAAASAQLKMLRVSPG